MQIIGERIKYYIRARGILNAFEKEENVENVTTGGYFISRIWQTFLKNRDETTREYDYPKVEFFEHLG